MNNLKKVFYAYGSLILLLVVLVGVTFATFTSEATVDPTMVTVASTSIKLMDGFRPTVDPAFLTNMLPGPTFEDITDDWSEDYVVQIYNTGTTDVSLVSRSDYVVPDDPTEVRQALHVTFYEWTDTNGDGAIQEDEFLDTSYGDRTIVRWKTQGFDLGVLHPQELRTFVLRFTAPGLTDAHQGQMFMFKFSFEGLGS